MRLTVQLPVLAPRLYGKYRNRIAYEQQLMPIETTVHAVRLIKDDPGAVEVDAFIPEQYRGQIDGPRSKWVDTEVRRCIAWIEDNPKSLRAFLESGDAEWDLRGDK
jgi:hypothetical protein